VVRAGILFSGSIATCSLEPWRSAPIDILTRVWNRAHAVCCQTSNRLWLALAVIGARLMTKELVRYRRLERRLWITRWRHDGAESAEEEMLDEMESACMDLSENEQAVLRTEGPRCWPEHASALPPQFLDAIYVSEPEPWACEGFSSPLQAILSLEAA
jgi:hypothetical protein